MRTTIDTDYSRRFLVQHSMAFYYTHTQVSVVLSVQVLIVNPETLLRCKDLVVGEIWVHGGSKAGGYLNRPDLTERFHAICADGEGSDHGGFLRTGDLGFLNAGQLFVTGRFKVGG